MSAQALAALERANEIRLANAEIRRKVKQMPHEVGREWAAQMVEDPVDSVSRMTVEHLLRSIERVGPLTAALWASTADVERRARLENLTVRQRLELAQLLRGEA